MIARPRTERVLVFAVCCVAFASTVAGCGRTEQGAARHTTPRSSPVRAQALDAARPIARGDASGPDAGAASVPVATGLSAVALVAQATAIVAGGDATCASLVGGEIRCWGAGLDGAAHPHPVAEPAWRGATPFAISPLARCGATRGALRCEGRLGGVEPDVSTLRDVDRLAVGLTHACARTPGGEVRCWGAPFGHELEQRGTDWFMRPNVVARTPIAITGLRPVEEIVAGDVHGCARDAAGTVRCWGDGATGALGDGSFAVRRSAVLVLGVTGARGLAAGIDHTCTLLEDGTVRCWGSNDHGALGHPWRWHHPHAVEVPSLSGVAEIAAGGSQTCARLASGEVACWGAVLGFDRDPTTSAPSPMDDPLRPNVIWSGARLVRGITGATALAVGTQHACALVAGGRVVCWGANQRGQLGDGTTTDRRVQPGPRPPGRAFVAPVPAPATRGPSILEDDGAALRRWVAARVRAARSRRGERVRLPIVQRGPFGCECPLYYIGDDPTGAQGAWLAPTFAPGVVEPTFDDRVGGAYWVEGRFTGRSIVERFQGEPYVMLGLQVERVLGPVTSGYAPVEEVPDQDDGDGDGADDDDDDEETSVFLAR
ncbi:MAG: hypothetical protein IT379_41150 [Deltaproteobacteria bacterium]|nr:hypothetical protein [Deltaproteobacteria bacterium]